MEFTSLMLLFSITIILGFIGSMIFEKTKIPDIVWLLLFGILVGPVFNLVDVELFRSMSDFLVAIALLIILFDAGLNMDLYQFLKQVPRSFVISIVGIFITVLAVGGMSIALFGFDFMTGILLGVIVGGTSSPIVIPIVQKLRIRENVKTILDLESVLTDPMCIVIAIAIIDIMVSPLQTNIAHNIMSSFSIGAVFGLIVGLIWLTILDKIRNRPFDYMLTMAALLLVYVITESVQGSGAIAALVFGLVIGNSVAFSKIMRFKKRIRIKGFMKRFHKEISFFIRSFFFVYLGLFAVIKPTYLVYGVLLSVIIILVRFLTVELSMFKYPMTEVEKNLMRTITPKGLAAAVLAQLPYHYGLPGGEVISNVVFIIILVTVLYSSIVIRFVYTPETKAIPMKKGKL